MGIITIARNPRRVEAHRGFNFSYICVANSWAQQGSLVSLPVKTQWRGNVPFAYWECRAKKTTDECGER